MNTSRLVSFAILTSMLFPTSAFALEGIGPRITVTGIVQEVRISKDQAFEKVGAEIIIKATNGQLVTVVLTKDSTIMSEGRMSRKTMIPVNITVGMQVRVRGWRANSDSLTASLFIIMNIALNPVLSQNGVLTAVDGNKITVLGVDGQSRSFTLTNETEVSINYTLYGTNAVTLLGKQALLTLNPNDSSLVRILRITGDKPNERTAKPTTIDLGVRTVD